jgi:choline transport protein
MEKGVEPEQTSSDVSPTAPHADAHINASGHRQELDRNFGLINICGLAVTSGNTWIAIGGSIVCSIPEPNTTSYAYRTQVTAIYNGGPPGVIYEL